jgi:DNA-binding MarR family transcriptional regulator
MLTWILSTLRDLGAAVRDAYALPGEVALSLLVTHAPGIAVWLNIDDGQAPLLMTFLLSLAYWFLVIVLLVYIVRLCRSITRYVDSLLRTGLYHVSHLLAGIKTTTVLRLRGLFSRRRRRRADDDAPPMIEFDRLDMAVLRSVSAKGPGFALAAPDLADRFKLRPSQVQRSLDKLSNSKMLVSVIGNTDGYENYRITDYGHAYIAMLMRQSSRA